MSEIIEWEVDHDNKIFTLTLDNPKWEYPEYLLRYEAAGYKIVKKLRIT